MVRGGCDEIAHSLSAGCSCIGYFNISAHIAEQFDQASARGIEAHIFDDDVRSRYEQRRNHREGGGGRIAGHDNILRLQLGLALYGYDPRDRKSTRLNSSH